jgi:hypothetical protein
MFLGRRLHRFLVCFSVEFLTWFCFVLFGFLSLESDLLTSTGSSKTHASPRWSPDSSGPAASNHSHTGSSRSARGLHVLERWSLPESARVGHGLSFSVRLGFFLVDMRCFGGFLMQMRSLMAVRVLHTLSSATVPPDADLDFGFCFRVFYVFYCLFTVCLCDA